MTDIFREVDEDIRQERYLKIWKRYGRYVAGAATLVVLTTAAYVAWRDYDAIATRRAKRRVLEGIDVC